MTHDSSLETYDIQISISFSRGQAEGDEAKRSCVKKYVRMNGLRNTSGTCQNDTAHAGKKVRSSDAQTAWGTRLRHLELYSATYK